MAEPLQREFLAAHTAAITLTNTDAALDLLVYAVFPIDEQAQH